MKIKEIIEKSIKGGWAYKDEEVFNITIIENSSATEVIIWYKSKTEAKFDDKYPLAEIVLDPKFWEAVITTMEKEDNISFLHQKKEDWAKSKMYRMVDYLCEGGSIEDYLKTL